MAKIINQTNHLEEELVNNHNKFKKRFKYCSIAFLVFCLYMFITNRGGLPLILFLVIPFGILTYVTGFNRDEVLVSGLEGERRALEVLSELSDEYTIISDLEIVNGTESAQIDSVIVGPNGVFIMETKNVKADKVSGKEEDHDLLVDKVGRKGGEYSYTMYNPCKQVGGHVYKLSKLLKNENVSPWIQGLVFFSNTKTNVYVESIKVPVFSYSNQGAYQVMQYITNYNKGRKLSIQEQNKVVEILSKYIM